MDLTISTLANRSIDQMFSCFDRVLDKGDAAAKAKGVEESIYLNWRAAPDMHPMKTQVRFAMEAARQLALLADVETPPFTEDGESFAELRENLRNSREIVKRLPAQELDRAPDSQITVPVGSGELTMTRLDYFQNFILPNLFFHTTVGYLILRHLGVELGKGDFLFADV